MRVDLDTDLLALVSLEALLGVLLRILRLHGEGRIRVFLAHHHTGVHLGGRVQRHTLVMLEVVAVVLHEASNAVAILYAGRVDLDHVAVDVF